MELLAFLLNLPWTLLALAGAVISLPNGVELHNKPLAIIIHVKSFWWSTWKPSKKGSRAKTQGYIILLGPSLLPGDIEHELIHVQQFKRAPLIQPILYTYQSLRYGYRNNKYEVEAYTKSGSPYLEKD